MVDRSAASPTDDELEARLRSAAAALSTPDPAELLERLSRRIAEDSPGQVGESGKGWRWLAVAAVIAVLAGLATAVVPAGRRAVAGWLGLRGVSITRPAPTTAGAAPAPSPVPTSSPTGPGPTTTTTGAGEAPLDAGTLDLGAVTTLDAAVGASPFTVQVLTDPALGPPTATYRREPPAGGMVTFVHRADGRLVLFSQFTATTTPFLGKMLDERTTLTPVDVGTARGYWISGTPHQLLYEVGDQVIDDHARLAGDTLLWDIGDQTYRIEGAPDLPTALRWAASMRAAT